VNRVVGAVLARNEAEHLDRCLATLDWTDSLVVMLDARAIPRCRDVALAHRAIVCSHVFESFPNQRNAVLEQVRAQRFGEWVLFLDPDERASVQIAAEVRCRVGEMTPRAPVGYWIPRRNFIWGGWVRHGGWSPDYQLRLLRVDQANYDESRDVHELVKLAGPVGHLREPLIHYNYDSVSQFLSKQQQYARLESRRLAREGRHPRLWAPAVQPIREFRRRYVELGGYRDGWRGLALAGLLAYYAGETYGRLVAGRS
jgi:hypothetical protein